MPNGLFHKQTQNIFISILYSRTVCTLARNKQDFIYTERDRHCGYVVMTTTKLWKSSEQTERRGTGGVFEVKRARVWDSFAVVLLFSSRSMWTECGEAQRARFRCGDVHRSDTNSRTEWNMRCALLVLCAPVKGMHILVKTHNCAEHSLLWANNNFLLQARALSLFQTAAAYILVWKSFSIFWLCALVPKNYFIHRNLLVDPIWMFSNILLNLNTMAS